MGCRKKVLIVDDDLGVLQHYRQLLGGSSREEGGTETLSVLMELVEEPGASSGQPEHDNLVLIDQGEEAVEEVARSVRVGEPFEIAFLDMRMPPGMDGRETALRLRALQPELPIVFVSAYSNHLEQSLAEELSTAPIYFKNKPFSRTDLRAAILEWAL